MVSLLKRDQKGSVFSVLPSIGCVSNKIWKEHNLSVFCDAAKSRLISDLNKRAVAFVILPLKNIVGEELKDFNDLGVPEIKLFIDHGPKSIRDAAWAYKVCWANKASRAIFASQLGNIGLL